jgi:hypothetical protein
MCSNPQPGPNDVRALFVHRPSILRTPIVKRKSSALFSPLVAGSAQRIVATTKATSLPAMILIAVMSKGVVPLDQEKNKPKSSCKLRFRWIEMVAEHQTSRCRRSGFGESQQNLYDARRRPGTQPHCELPRCLPGHKSAVSPAIAKNCPRMAVGLLRPAVPAQERWLNDICHPPK